MTPKSLSDFDILIELHSREIYSYLWRMLRDLQDAEDSLQETFLRAFRGFPRLREDSNYRAWFYKIATNVAYTHLKRRARHTSNITDLTDFNAISSPIDFQQKELLETVLTAVESLPHKQRAALLLRNYQGLSFDEIGETLECSPESARANLYQALKKLRAQLTEVEQ
jgi:RNA polymerase sigma-70 factor (ECF subfamily)